MNIDIEIPWQTFKTLPNIQRLSLNEQRLQYHYYIQSLEKTKHNSQIQTWTTVPEAGDVQPTPTIPIETFFLLQENGDYILQENNDKIRLE